MAFFGCLALFLCGIWDVISQSLNSCLGRTVGEALDPLRERAVAEVRDRTRFWGNRVEQVNTSATCDLAGLEEIRGYEREIVDSLRDDRVRVIGIHGMGGIGKTTLLERINNNFSDLGAPPDFNVVIYATVSKEGSLPNVRKSIGKRIGLDLSAAAGDSAEEQADLIFKTLHRKRFLLLLDDVWEEIEWKDIGIPQPTPQNRCKVILTTRSVEVCRLMRAEKLVEVKGLNPGESWRLFKENVGAGVDLESPTIYSHAKAVAEKCGGLPLAINTVGRAMADANSVGEWKAALAQLTDIPSMTEKVLIPLKFSYERLREETLKQCLLYCCLYPEHREISVEEIIELWVGEGFLDKEVQSNTVAACRNRGRGVITRLVTASLLQSCSSAERVKMHDVVREMCLWLTGEAQTVDKNNAFLVLTSGASNCMYSIGRWKDKKRISMIGNATDRLPDAPLCPCLQTLLCPRHAVRLVIPQGFFQYMPLLRVLDLSYSDVESLPDDIGLLPELRYLDLQNSRIESLPKGFGRLTKLTQLNLNGTWSLRHIPLEAIPVLTYQVRVLRMFESYDLLSLLLAANSPTNDRWGDHEDHGECSSTPSTTSSSVDGTILKAERRRWNNLEEVGLSVKSLDAFNELLSSDALCKCCIDLAIDGVENIPIMDLALAFAKLENVRYLRLENSSMEGKGAVKLYGASDFGQSLDELCLVKVIHLDLEVTSPSSFRSLRELVISECHSIRHIDWVRQLPSLHIILLGDCENIGELLLPTAHHREGHCDSSSLFNLKVLYLWRLPALTCISSSPMLFPALKVLDVRNCPKLSKLPLVSSSGAPDMERISCPRSLWESLEDSTQSRFLPVYKENVEDE